MKVLQFAFDSEEIESNFLPYNYCSRNSVVYTGTHDNSTIIGWFKERSPVFILAYFTTGLIFYHRLLDKC
jgi:4-alpha-glucanotransferase